MAVSDKADFWRRFRVFCFKARPHDLSCPGKSRTPDCFVRVLRRIVNRFVHLCQTVYYIRAAEAFFIHNFGKLVQTAQIIDKVRDVLILCADVDAFKGIAIRRNRICLKRLRTDNVMSRICFNHDVDHLAGLWLQAEQIAVVIAVVYFGDFICEISERHSVHIKKSLIAAKAGIDVKRFSGKLLRNGEASFKPAIGKLRAPDVSLLHLAVERFVRGAA